jgi:hypothetical protein
MTEVAMTVELTPAEIDLLIRALGDHEAARDRHGLSKDAAEKLKGKLQGVRDATAQGPAPAAESPQ